MEKLHLQPSELDALPYYEYEYTVEIYNDILKERKDAEEKNQDVSSDKYNIKGMQRDAMRNASNKAAKFKTPNIRIPKI